MGGRGRGPATGRSLNRPTAARLRPSSPASTTSLFSTFDRHPIRYLLNSMLALLPTTIAAWLVAAALGPALLGPSTSLVPSAPACQVGGELTLSPLSFLSNRPCRSAAASARPSPSSPAVSSNDLFSLVRRQQASAPAPCVFVCTSVSNALSSCGNSTCLCNNGVLDSFVDCSECTLQATEPANLNASIASYQVTIDGQSASVFSIRVEWLADSPYLNHPAARRCPSLSFSAAHLLYASQPSLDRLPQPSAPRAARPASRSPT